MTPPTRHDAGFTLVETIAALAILALIVALLPGTLRLGARAWETAARLDDESAVIAGRTFLAQRLAESVPLFTDTGDGQLGLAFRGDHNTLEFVAPSAGGPAGGGLYRYRLEAVDIAGTADRGLLLRQTPYREGDAASLLRRPGGDERILFARARKIGLRYFGRPEAGAAPRWLDAWIRADAQPDLIEFSFDGAPGVEGQPLTIPLRLGNAG